MIIDYHVHLRGPGQGREGPIDHTVEAIERYVEAAASRGVDEIGFTEHMYYFREFAELVEHPYQRSRIGHDLDPYVDTLVEAKRQGLPVKIGIEVDWIPGRTADLRRILDRYPWDFLLGSVHIVDGEPVDMEPGLWALHSVEEVWRRYFAEACALARSGLVDVLAHPDLVKIFGMHPSEAVVEELHLAFADAAAEGGVAVEVSSAGLRKRVGEVYPAPALLEVCAARDVPATLASDAHLARDLGLGLEEGIRLLRAAGYGTVTVFEQRRPRQEPLG